VNEVIKTLEKEKLVSLERHCIYLTDIKSLGKKLNGIDLSIKDPREKLTSQNNSPLSQCC